MAHFNHWMKSMNVWWSLANLVLQVRFISHFTDSHICICCYTAQLNLMTKKRRKKHLYWLRVWQYLCLGPFYTRAVLIRQLDGRLPRWPPSSNGFGCSMTFTSARCHCTNSRVTGRFIQRRHQIPSTDLQNKAPKTGELWQCVKKTMTQIRVYISPYPSLSKKKGRTSMENKKVGSIWTRLIWLPRWSGRRSAPDRLGRSMPARDCSDEKTISWPAERH